MKFFFLAVRLELSFEDAKVEQKKATRLQKSSKDVVL